MRTALDHSLILFISLVFVLMSCEKDNNETKVSQHNGDSSHKSGEDCMGCHTSGGSGEGIFTVAGTVYDLDQLNPYPNATVRIYTGPNATGDLVKTIEVDGKGNFYTTEFMDFEGGMYTSITGTSGSVEHMITTVSSGRCNSCHNVQADRIWVK